MGRDFNSLLASNWRHRKFLCVGLDPDLAKIPEAARRGSARETLAAFNAAIMDATKDVACAYKLNSAFYEAHGEDGQAALADTIRYVRQRAPEAVVILDAKRADIGNTNKGYLAAAFELLGADAITLHPYLGSEALRLFLERKDKGLFILCRTSNPGAGEFQDLLVDGEPLYVRVARTVAQKWNGNGNCGLVVGATYPDEIRNVRAVAPALPLLIPGTGAQGGDLKRSVAAALSSDGAGFLISVSRALLFASNGPDFAEAAGAMAREFDETIRVAIPKPA